MTRMDKNAIYDELSFALTDYEDPQGQGCTEMEAANEMYDVLVKIQNSWEELTGDDD